jgi:hypothetical protein
MFRHLMLLCVGVLLIHRPAEAALELSFDTSETPPLYTPGVPFDILVKLENATNLNSFDFELLLSADSGVAGTDFFFVGAAKPEENYVFPSDNTGGYLSNAQNHPDGVHHSLFVTDFLDSPTEGVDTGPMNNLLARVTVQANQDVGNLMIAFDPEGANFFDPNFGELEVTSFAAPHSVAAIPEPSTWAICVLCGAGFVAYRWKNRRKLAA